MNLTFSSLLQSCLATLAYLLLTTPAGYGLGRLSDVCGFRNRSATEQCLWSVVLSLPLVLVVTNVGARYFSLQGAFVVLILLSVAGLVLILLDHPVRHRVSWPSGPYANIVILALIGEAVYIWCAGAPLQFGHRLYEPVFSGDWEVRFPLVQAAAMQNGVPPHSPFFTFKGQSPPMRYYYYWYSVCGMMAKVLHVGPRAALLASSVYAALCIVAVLFLYQKYMLTTASSLRQRCALLLALCCVLGLDVIPSTLRLMFWRVHLLPEIEWWSQDRTPGLPAVVIYAPHHVAGAACGLLAFLFLSLLIQEERVSPARTTVYTLLVGLVFTALVGTSTFICMFFAVACTVLCADRLLKRDRRAAVVLTGAAVISLLLSAPYLHELLAKAVTSGAHAQHKHLLLPKLRDNDFAHTLVWKMSLVLHRSPPAGLMRFLFRAPVIPLLYLCELGFFLIVVVVRYRQDFLSARPIAFTSRALWLLAGSIAIFFLFVSSQGVQSINDLGLQAGLVLRLVFITWGAQLAAEWLDKRDLQNLSPKNKWVVRAAYGSLALGLTMTVWQAVVERTYAVFVDRHALPAISPYPYAFRIGTVYQDVYDAQAAVARLLPADAVVQSDPTGRYQTIYRLYQTRRQAAGDETCEGAFGGDPDVCQSFLPGLLHLFGSHPPFSNKHMHGPKPNPADMTLAAMTSLCSQVGIAALSASRADPAWYQPDSWVWRGELMYSNNTVRVIRCPQPPPSSAHL